MCLWCAWWPAVLGGRAGWSGLLVCAGFETRVNLIGNGIVALLQHHDHLGLLHQQPNLWPNAIEEILHLHSSEC